MDAPNPTTLVIHYDKAVANVLPQLEQFFVLPEHVWEKYAGNERQGPEDVPARAAPADGRRAARTRSASSRRRARRSSSPTRTSTGRSRTPQAVAMTYYTNSTSMIADLQAGNIDFVDQVPYNAISSLKSDSRFELQSVPSSEVTNITFNSNPLKPKNRELLEPAGARGARVRDRPQPDRQGRLRRLRPAVGEHALAAVGAFWLNPAIKPLPYDIAKANQILDSLGYKRGLGRGADRAGDDRQVRAARPPDGVRRDRARQPRLQRRPPVPDPRQRLGQDRGQAARGRRRRQRPGLRARDGGQVHEVRLRHVGLGRVHRSRRPALRT